MSSNPLEICELLSDNNQCFYLDEASVPGLEIANNAESQSNLSLNITNRYKAVAKQETLSKKCFEIISN